MLTEQLVTNPQNGLRSYQGGILDVIVSPEQTKGELAIFKMTTASGSEPPCHVHTREDETFHVIEGIVRFQIGEDIIVAGPGQTVFAPRNIPHKFNIQSKRASMLTILTPGDFINYFLEWSHPIDEEPATIQAPQGPPPAELLAQWVELLNNRYAVYFV